MEDSSYYARQIGCALVPILSSTATGMTMGYSAVLLPQLKVAHDVVGASDVYVTNATGLDDLDGFEVLTIDEESWIAASAVLAMVTGCWTAPFLMAKLGRKTAFLVINPVALAGWLTIALARNLGVLIAGRLLCGLCVGLVGGTSSVYITETSHPRIRGLLLAALSLAVAVGIFVVHALGTWLHWRLTAYVVAATPIYCFALGVFALESPVFLLSRGKREDALAAWTLLRGNHSIAEFQALKATHESSTSSNEVASSSGPLDRKTRLQRWRSLWTVNFANRRFRMPLLIVCACAFISQFSGINVVTFYCVQMIHDVSGPDHAYLGTLVLDIARVVVGTLACWLTRQYPRRTLALVSGVGTGLTLVALAGCLFADFGRPWLPIVLLFVYVVAVGVGLMPLPWLLGGELFAGKSRGLGSGLSGGFAFFCFFVVVKTGPLAFDVLTPAGTFVLYGAVALLGSVYLGCYLPETKDKTLGDIENVFAGGKTRGPVREDKSITISTIAR